MDILKKNLVLFIVIGVSVIVSGILVFMSIGGYGEMNDAIKRVEEIKEKIKGLAKQKPAPHITNQIRIKKDIETYRNLVDNVFYAFGQPYRDALKAYISALDMDEKTFMEKFSEFWEQNATVGSNRYQVFQKFVNTFNSFKQAKAKEIFKQLYQKNTCEKIDDSNVNDIIMSAIGVPRSLSTTDFRVFLSQMQSELLKFMNANEVVMSDKFTTFSFGDFMNVNANTTLNKDDVALVVESFLMIGDLVKLAVNSNVKEFVSVSRGALAGTADGKFTRYRFSLEMVGDMDSLQRFVNALYDAYVMNKVYIIKNVEFEVTSDKAKEIITELIDFQTGKTNPAANPAVAPEMGMMPPAGMIPGRPQDPKKTTAKKEDEKKADVPFYLEKNYGKPVIGGGKRCKMILDVDYVVFNRQKFTIKE